jgi:hypothetical protein
VPHCILQIGKESAHGEHLGASYAKPTPAVPFFLRLFPYPMLTRRSFTKLLAHQGRLAMSGQSTR